MPKICVIFECEFGRCSSAAWTGRNTNVVFGKDTTTERAVALMVEWFWCGDFGFQSEPRGRQKAKVDNDVMKVIMEANTSQTTLELATGFEVLCSNTLPFESKRSNKKFLMNLTNRRRERASKFALFCCYDINMNHFHIILQCVMNNAFLLTVESIPQTRELR